MSSALIRADPLLPKRRWRPGNAEFAHRLRSSGSAKMDRATPSEGRSAPECRHRRREEERLSVWPWGRAHGPVV